MDDTDLLYNILYVPVDPVDPTHLCAVLRWTGSDKEIC